MTTPNAHVTDVSGAIDVKALLRQKPPFQFVDRIRHLDLEQREIEAVLEFPSAVSRFVREDRLPSFLLIEALAQVSGAMLALQAGSSSPEGYLVGMRHLTLPEDPRLPASFRLCSRLREENRPFFVFDCEIFDRDSLRVANAELTLFANYGAKT